MKNKTKSKQGKQRISAYQEEAKGSTYGKRKANKSLPCLLKLTKIEQEFTTKNKYSTS